jgi:hypothetical protein
MSLIITIALVLAADPCSTVSRVNRHTGRATWPLLVAEGTDRSARRDTRPNIGPLREDCHAEYHVGLHRRAARLLQRSRGLGVVRYVRWSIQTLGSQ